MLSEIICVSIAGTLSYCPPEYLEERKYDGIMSTVYTLGICLYDMANGNVPFNNENEILSGEVTFRQRLSPGWCMGICRY